MDVVFTRIYQKELGLMFNNIILEVIYITFSFELMSLSHGDFERCFSFFPLPTHLAAVNVYIMFCSCFFFWTYLIVFCLQKKTMLSVGPHVGAPVVGMCTGTRGLDRHVPILFDIRSSGLEVRSVFFVGKISTSVGMEEVVFSRGKNSSSLAVCFWNYTLISVQQKYSL